MPAMLQKARGLFMSACLITPLLTAPAYAAPASSSVKAKTEVFVDKASDVATVTGQAGRDVWTKMNTELPYSDGIYEVRAKALGVVAPVDRALGGGLNWTDNTMSRPALFLMLAFLAVMTLLGMSSATARTGNHH